MQATSQAGGRKRKGVILLVVLAMITLLTILGITFVMYADSSEATARINMESEKIHQVDWTGNELMQLAFGQLVFDVEDDELGQQSGMRGHSLARDMYGYRYGATTGQIENNDRPFRGTGRLNILNPLTGLPDNQLINFSTFYMGANNPEQIRDPERLARTTLTIPNGYGGGFNPPYTYPDLNHVFLAKYDPNTGEVLEPSFVRSAATGLSSPMGTLTDWGNSNSVWNDPAGKYRMVRPRKAEHPQFPFPSDSFGDVRNLPWGTHNDAVWIDLGVTPKTAANGKKYKPLFAYTILDLDGRVNLNAHGNIHGCDQNGNPTHASRQGGGPWEVNLGTALQNPIYTAQNSSWKFIMGRGTIDGRFTAPGGSLGGFYYPITPGVQHTHAPVDFNASTDLSGVAQANPLPLPGANYSQLPFNAPTFLSTLSPFGTFVQNVYGAGADNEILINPAGPRAPFSSMHGAAFNPFGNHPTASGNKLFSNSHFGVLQGRAPRNPYLYLSSELFRLNLFGTSPFDPSSSRDPRYDRVTTMSWDLDRPGMVPYLSDRTSNPLLQAPVVWEPSLPLIPGNHYPKVGTPSGTRFNPVNTGEFDAANQSALALAKRLNLRRTLTPYPLINPTTGQYPVAAAAQVAAAQNERVQFAQDIYAHLVMVTGALTPIDPGFPGLPNRWLAQLAANMVDNFDSDEVMTAFPFNPMDPTQIVYGKELSRLVINEVFPQLENDPTDLMNLTTKDTPASDFKLKLFIELHNPLLPNNGSPTDDHSAIIKNISGDTVHVLELVNLTQLTNGTPLDRLTDPSQNAALVGMPNPLQTTTWTNWNVSAGPLAISPADPTLASHFQAALNTGKNAGYFVVGPSIDATSSFLPGFSRFNPASNQNDCLVDDALGRWPINKATTSLNNLADFPVVVLRRLVDPYLPPSVSNPYVTIDMTQITPEMISGGGGFGNDARKLIKNPGMKGKNNPDYKDEGSRASFNRPQPYHHVPASFYRVADPMLTTDNGKYGTLRPQTAPSDYTSGPKTTFWRYNGKNAALPPPFVAPGTDTFETPRYSLHLDRVPLSIGEALTTATCRPHEFPFFNNASADYVAGWHDPNTRLYRFLELVQAGDTRVVQNLTLTDPFNGNPLPFPAYPVQIGAEGGRIPGKINVNTMSKEVFSALCDAQPTNRFTQAQVDQVWLALQTNRPYWGFGMGEYSGANDPLGGPVAPAGNIKRGMNQSLLREHPGLGVASPFAGTRTDTSDLLNLMLDGQNAFNNPGGMRPPTVLGTAFGQAGAELPPSVRQELLSKIIGNTTSRSNCFAVWVTVGYFEVVSDQGGTGSTYAPQMILGMEMQPRTRRRFFSMIDRTQLEAWRVELSPGSGIVPATNVDPMTGQLILQVSVPLSQLFYNAPSGPINLAAGTIFQSSTGKSYPIKYETPTALASVLTFDPNTLYEETVEVVDLGGGAPGVYLQRPHGVNGVPVTVCSRGNPGPIPFRQVNLDDLQKKGLIPYFQVLE